MQKLIIGKWYNLKAKNYAKSFSDRDDAPDTIRMRLVELYPHMAVFERKAGWRESFTYWELVRVMR